MIQYLQNEKATLKYILTTPTDFDISESLPMVVFLHGAGERGNEIEKIKAHGIPKLFSKNQDHEGLRAITLSPQCPDERTWYDYKWDVIALIDEVAEKYNVDKLVYFETTDSIESAIKREKQLKNWHREWKINLIKGNNPDFRDLSLDWE